MEKVNQETGEITQEPDRGPKTFTQTLDELEYGALSERATAELRAVISAVRALRKPGEVSITLKFKPGSGDQVEVVPEIKSKIPKPALQSALMFFGKDGNLQRNDPRQMELSGLKVVDNPSGTLRTIDAASPTLRSQG